MNSFFEQNSNYLDYKHIYENIPYLDTYAINQEMNVIPKESIFIFSEKDDINKENHFNERMTKANSKDNESILLEKLTNQKKLLFFNKNNSDKNPSFLLEPPKYEIIKKENENEEKNIKKLCGQKKARKEESSDRHDKYADDIIRRKCKFLVIRNLLDFLKTN